MTPFAMVMRSGRMSNASQPNMLAQPAEAADHLVGDQQDVVPLEDFLDGRVVAGQAAR